MFVGSIRDPKPWKAPLREALWENTHTLGSSRRSLKSELEGGGTFQFTKNGCYSPLPPRAISRAFSFASAGL